MHPKIKNRPATGKNQVPITTVKPLLLHEVTNQNASAAAASRHGLAAKKSVAGTANHARHHVSRSAQS
jgi:hypothetical protein